MGLFLLHNMAWKWWAPIFDICHRHKKTNCFEMATKRYRKYFVNYCRWLVSSVFIVNDTTDDIHLHLIVYAEYFLLFRIVRSSISLHCSSLSHAGIFNSFLVLFSSAHRVDNRMSNGLHANRVRLDDWPAVNRTNSLAGIVTARLLSTE